MYPMSDADELDDACADVGPVHDETGQDEKRKREIDELTRRRAGAFMTTPIMSPEPVTLTHTMPMVASTKPTGTPSAMRATNMIASTA